MTIVACTGHQVLPLPGLPHISRGIRGVLHAYNPAELVGTCSLAAGADQLFANSVLDAGGRLHVVIPCEGYDNTLQGNDRRTYEDLRSRAVHVETLAYPAPSENAYLAAGRRVVDLAEVLIAVWDGQPAHGPGGTADIVDYATRTQVETIIIWPAGLDRPSS